MRAPTVKQESLVMTIGNIFEKRRKAHQIYSSPDVLSLLRSGVLQMAVAIHLFIAFQQSILNYDIITLYLLLRVTSGVLPPTHHPCCLNPKNHNFAACVRFRLG